MPVECLALSKLGSDHKFQGFLHHLLDHCVKLDPLAAFSDNPNFPRALCRLGKMEVMSPCVEEASRLEEEKKMRKI